MSTSQAWSLAYKITKSGTYHYGSMLISTRFDIMGELLRTNGIGWCFAILVRQFVDTQERRGVGDCPDVNEEVNRRIWLKYGFIESESGPSVVPKWVFGLRRTDNKRRYRAITPLDPLPRRRLASHLSHQHFLLPFALTFPYLGFGWDFPNKTASIPLKTRSKYLARLEPWLPGSSISLKDCQVVLGCLQHCTLALPDGRSRLPALYRLCSSFKDPNHPFIRHRIPSDCLSDVTWWRAQLSAPWCGSPISSPPILLPNSIFVDASTSGIGLILDGKWLAWKLSDGWRADGRDIGWAEMVAVDLGLRTLIHVGFHDCHLVLHSDNQGVVGALKSGRSWNVPQNLILRQIVANFRDHGIWLSVKWVKSEDNISDLISRGSFPSSHRIGRPPPLPQYLKCFISLA